WIPIQVSVHADSVDLLAGNNPAVSFKLSKSSTMAQLGFLLMGLKGNSSPTCKIRKVILNAPNPAMIQNDRETEYNAAMAESRKQLEGEAADENGRYPQ